MHSFSLSARPWQFRDTAKKTWHPARVPGCVHTDLQRAGLIPDPFAGTHELDLHWIEERDWEYRTQFEVPAALRAQAVIDLVADGLDTLATVVYGHASRGVFEDGALAALLIILAGLYPAITLAKTSVNRVG